MWPQWLLKKQCHVIFIITIIIIIIFFFKRSWSSFSALATRQHTFRVSTQHTTLLCCRPWYLLQHRHHQHRQNIMIFIFITISFVCGAQSHNRGSSETLPGRAITITTTCEKGPRAGLIVALKQFPKKSQLCSHFQVICQHCQAIVPKIQIRYWKRSRPILVTIQM